MLYIKQICTLVYLIIVVLFTVGYANQPLIMSDNKPLLLFNFNSINNITNIYSDAKYDNVNSNVKIVLMTEYYLCIAITVILSLGIICALFKNFVLKISSKIFFLISLIFMIIAFIILQILIIMKSLVSNITNTIEEDIKERTIPTSVNVNFETSSGTGYYLILVSTILMIFNYIIYTILA